MPRAAAGVYGGCGRLLTARHAEGEGTLDLELDPIGAFTRGRQIARPRIDSESFSEDRYFCQNETRGSRGWRHDLTINFASRRSDEHAAAREVV